MAMKVFTLDEIKDRHIGKVGTPERDRYERDLTDELQAYHIGETIKEARLARKLTLQQLGEKVGVQKSQISRLERGYSISLPNIARLFKAMGIPISLEIGGVKKVALW